MPPYRLLLLSLLLAAGQIGAAEDSGEDTGTTLVYDGAFFSQYRPVTALDMLRWVPGVADIVPSEGDGGGGGQRGFGSDGDQILLNGKRLSGKSNDIASALARIQADAVARVEVIRGTASGLDVRSQGLLVNVVLTENADRDSGSWQVHAGEYTDAGVLFDGLVSYSSGTDRMSYLASVEYGPFNRGDSEYRNDVFFPVDPNAPVTRIERVTPERDADTRINLSGSFRISDDDELNLNAQYVDLDSLEEQSIVRTVEGEPEPEEALDLRTEVGSEWELGGDLVNAIGPGQLKTRMIITRDEETEDDVASLVTILPTSDVVSTRVLTETEEGETIARSSYTWSLTASQRVEAGLEAAVNTLDRSTRLFEQLADGTVVEVPLFNSTASVEEERYESFITHFWTLSERTLLESALNVEWSTITQDGGTVELERSFEFIKPRFDFRHDFNDSDQLRVRVERLVSQLDFSNFVLEFDRDNDLIRGGNPDLTPELTWQYSATWEHRFPDDRGLISARFFYDDIEDHIDRIIGPFGFSSLGNIGDAWRAGLELKTSLRLDTVGIPGAVIDVVYTGQETEATDPFSGEKRRISGEPAHDVEFQFRHDIPAWRFNYLLEFFYRSKRFDYDVAFIDRQTDESPRMNLITQYQVRKGLLFYLQLRSVAGIDRLTVRERFDGPRPDSELVGVERRFRSFKQEIIAGFRGQF